MGDVTTSGTLAPVDALDAPVDVAVVGAGIVGLAVALEGARRGLRVALVERNVRLVGASVRNFGHICVTAQTGAVLEYALKARSAWLDLADRARLWLRESGTLVVARADDELAVLEEFAAERGADQVRLLHGGQVGEIAPIRDAAVIGGAYLPLDLRVDPRSTTPRLLEHAGAAGVRIFLDTNVLGVEEGVLHTSRGRLRAALVVLALGHDLDRLAPAAARAAGLRRCTLHMLRIASPRLVTIDPAVLTGTSLLRYPAFADTQGAAAVRARLASTRPELLAAGVNHMITQHPSGDLLVGDTHAYAATVDPFADEQLDDLLLAETAQLLGVMTAVRERWRGTYAWAAGHQVLVTAPVPGVTAVTVASGIGMTTALGLAPAVLDGTALSLAA